MGENLRMAEEQTTVTGIEPIVEKEDGSKVINPEWEQKRADDAKARAEGKKPQPIETTDDATGKGKDDSAPNPKLTPGQRRQLNQLTRKAEYEKGRADALQEMLDRGLTPKQAEQKLEKKEANAKPDPKDFKTGAADPEYIEALSTWTANKVTRESDADRQAAEEYRRDAEIAAEAASKDIEDLFSEVVGKDSEGNEVTDWDRVAAEAAEDEDAPGWNNVPKGHKDHVDGWPVRPFLTEMLQRSPIRARFAYYCAKNPEALRTILKHDDGSPGQILAFERLAGRLEVLYSPKKPSDKEKKTEGKSKEEPKVHKPSSEVSVKSGTAAATEIPITIKNRFGQDVINPAWEAQRNAKAGRRA